MIARGYTFLDLPNYEINFNNLVTIPKNNHQRLEKYDIYQQISLKMFKI